MNRTFSPSGVTFQNICDVPCYWARHTPGETAQMDGERHLSYAQLQELVTAADEVLSVHGVLAGHRVMLVAENCSAPVAFLFAASARGAFAAVVNARLSAPEIAAFRAHCEPQAVVYLSADFEAAAGHAMKTLRVPS
jgi:long-chain acyl-CoA synthetase